MSAPDLWVYVCAGTGVRPSDVRRCVGMANHRAAAGGRAIVLLDHAQLLWAEGLRAGVALDTVDPAAEGRRFFCAEQADADRVLRTLVARKWGDEPMSLVFVGCVSVALDVVRARRLLGLFRGVSVEIAADGGVRSTRPGTISEVFTRWAAEYVHRHARTLLDRDPGSSFGRVSAIIPLYNQGRYVREAVASVREDMPEAEIVVVNDGSTDEMTNQVFADLTGTIRIHQDNQGVAAARNAGIRRCTGEYVLPLDADDLISPGFLAMARRALEGNPDLAYVVGHARYIGLLDLTYVPAGFIPELNLFLHTHGKAPGLYRKSAIESVGGYDPNFSAFEDWELQVALHRAGQHTDVIPQVSHYYRRHAQSMSFTTSNHMRPQLVQQIMRKHLPMLDADDLRTGMLVLAHLWKTQYEPSASVLLQQLNWPTERERE